MRKLAALIAVLPVICLTCPVFADSGDMMAMLEGMKKQMVKMQETIDQQNLRIQQLESRKVLETPPPSSAIQPSAPPPSALTDAVSWLKGAKFAGDLRLRMENFDFFDKNDDAGSTGAANDRSRNRFRFRLRWGFEKDFGDDWSLGFRLASGNTTEPTSTNQTLGNSGYFNFKTVNIDRAYAAYEPSALKNQGLLKSVKIGAGKFENPFLRWSTPMMWDSDVTPEGVYEQANIELVSADDTKVNVLTTLGQFITNENAAVDTDAGLNGYQGVLTISTHAFGTKLPVDLNTAVSYYDYYNWSQTVINNTASTSYLRTNSILADNFRVLDIYPELVFYVDRTPLSLWADYAVNTANEGTDDAARALGNDIHDSDDGWGLGFKFGKVKQRGTWEIFYGYYEIGVNAVPAAFNDADFGGPGYNGFTNRKGHKFGLAYQLTDSLVFNWTAYLVRPLHPFNGNATLGIQNSSNESIFRSQADLVFKF